MNATAALARAYLVALLVAPASCSSGAPYIWASELPQTELRAPPALRPGDKIQLAVFGQDTMSGEFEIRPSGEVVLPAGGGRFPAAGKTPEQLAFEVQTRLKGVLADPRVTIVIASRHPANVSVLGEVRAPGRFELVEGEGVLPALARAGGLTPFASPDRIFVVRTGNGQRIRFRYDDLTSARGTSPVFELRSGDVVVVE
jgi:polysaccharide export outer membrane protein